MNEATDLNSSVLAKNADLKTLKTARPILTILIYVSYIAIVLPLVNDGILRL